MTLKAIEILYLARSVPNGEIKSVTGLYTSTIYINNVEYSVNPTQNNSKMNNIKFAMYELENEGYIVHDRLEGDASIYKVTEKGYKYEESYSDSGILA